MQECTYCKAPANEGQVYCCQSCEFLANWVKLGLTPIEQDGFRNKTKISDKWNKYNISELEQEFNFSNKSEFKKFRFYIEGLQCSSCVHLIEDLPLYCDQVLVSRLNYSKRILEVEIKNEFLLGELCQLIEKLGYEPAPLKENSDYEKATRSENRKDLMRIGVAGAVAANEMLFAIPIYAGLDGPLAIVFKWIGFILFLPLVFYSAVPFYKKAWTSLIVRRVNVDMMIVVALLSGFVFSTYSLLRGSDDLYFDSTASFIFLILLTRYFLKHHQDKLIKKNIFADLFENDIYEVTQNNITQYLPFNKINVGQLVRIKANQLIPCDGHLKSLNSEFDFSFLTGEAYPQKRHQNDFLQAGSRLVSAEAYVQCDRAAIDSELAQSLMKIDLQRETKNVFQTITDIAAHRLTLVVFSLAALFFIFTYQYLGFEAFKRCLALITIACPCAVAFGTPLAHNLGLRKASQSGFFIKSENVFEKLNQIKKVIFDKTGTLTSSHLKLIRTFPPNISDEYKSIILGLEKSSLHPVAISLQQAWSQIPTKNINHVSEMPGIGVEASYDDDIYRLSKSSADNGDRLIQVDFSVNDRRIAYLYFEESIQPEAQSVIGKFYKKNFEVMMLSGDKRSRAIEVAKELRIRPAHVFAEQSADTKKIIVEKESPCLFVGDGLNDLPALQTAHVSFAIKGSFESTLQVSDIYAPKKNLNSLLEIFNLSEKVQSTVRANLFFALLYNTVGGAMALMGMINPLLAAILMPVSSFLITAHTTWRLR